MPVAKHKYYYLCSNRGFKQDSYNENIRSDQAIITGTKCYGTEGYEEQSGP